MNFDELDDVLEVQEAEDNDLIRFRRPYIVGDRFDNFNKWDNVEFYNRFRLSKETVLFLLPLIENEIKHSTDRNHAVTPLQQLLVALRFYSCGSFLIVLGDFGGLHRTTAGQIVKRVTSALVRLRAQFIQMPHTEEEKMLIKEQFYKISRFPRVLGAIDCTHIRIQSPGGEQAENFRNRKGFFSLNVQVVCDPNYKIRDIVCRWPGSSHGSNIFQNSTIMMRFENREMGRDVLLGDSGYPLRQYLITPLNNPQTPAEHLFNEAQIKTRTVIERTFGIWKRRFPILSLGLRNRLETTQDIIVAAAILHNIAQERNEPDMEGELEENADIDEYLQNNVVRNDPRQQFIDYFQTL